MSRGEITAVMPSSPPQVDAVAAHCRALVRRNALLAAGVAMVPVPGLDWVTDIGVLVKLIPQINEAFGLSQAQIERLAPDRRIVVYKALTASGGLLVGKVITREVVMQALRVVGVRLTTQQAAKFVPIAGQAVSAALTYSALRYVCEQHIRQCMAVVHDIGQVHVQPIEILRRVDLPDGAARHEAAASKERP